MADDGRPTFADAVTALRRWSFAAGNGPKLREAFRAECERLCGDPEKAEQAALFLDAFMSCGFEDVSALAGLVLERMPVG